MAWACASLLGAPEASVSGAAHESVSFRMHRVGTYRGEACGVGDFNNDSKLDIVALPYLYLAPEFKAHRICDMQGDVDESGKGYRDDFMNLPLDVDGDGRLDVARCTWFAKKAEWLRNPGPDGGPWERVLIEENGHYESGELCDVDGDGKTLEILPTVAATIWYEACLLPDGKRGTVKHVISEKAMTWGAGCGDINGDGRPDVLRPDAWFEAPADPRAGDWKEHPLDLGRQKDGKPCDTAQILVYDVNADGLADLICSAAHDYGIFWYEQAKKDGETAWTQHLIDDSWSQAHSLALADFDGDGDLDLVTGKRFMAHNGGDPGAFEPLGVYWYELTRQPAPIWNKHVVSYDQGIGSGVNILAPDLDGDGDADIVVTGKWGGPVWFENRRE
ncbi:MAG TPA: VCBS repeat-containing protein [Candidatus Hydrogenedentes bacterium]|nr:VCBS repeat-containing protein [Candidatus Hydrogenedentota bacterium]HOV75972.1 VCBS repeat-containing protein [Candidatus Hydrogenedentota bacterium]HPC16828.1 VCBS repeat-containing protein [Candidatus Hydrogenedentota bacterium]HRT21349.1 VCBS repeat-containing protein [Candidatus Hydrogenedentota bacterium]HRT66116.1 VCBS repeat-containing protein [Candidatus Hydrogenedentota bacterium]